MTVKNINQSGLEVEMVNLAWQVVYIVIGWKENRKKSQTSLILLIDLGQGNLTKEKEYQKDSEEKENEVNHV